MNKEKYEVYLTRNDAEDLRGTLTKHSSAVVMEKVQRQILEILDLRKIENKNNDK